MHPKDWKKTKPTIKQYGGIADRSSADLLNPSQWSQRLKRDLKEWKLPIFVVLELLATKC